MQIVGEVKGQRFYFVIKLNYQHKIHCYIYKIFYGSLLGTPKQKYTIST